MITKTKNSIVTTNVRIPKDELLVYREYALSEGKSFSQLVREILAQAVTPGPTRKSRKKISFWDVQKYAVSLKGGSKSSQEVDKVVYNYDRR